MQIVIDVPTDTYEYIKEGTETSIDESNAIYAIKHGTVLPEGHGRLIDADAVLQDIEELQKSPWYNNQILPMASLISLHEGVEVVRDICIQKAPTIVEADKGGE